MKDDYEYSLLQACAHFQKKRNQNIVKVTYIPLEKRPPISFHGPSAMPVPAQTDRVLPNTQNPQGQTRSQFRTRFPNTILQCLGKSSSRSKYASCTSQRLLETFCFANLCK